MTIGHLARECDVPVSTIRYWERAGLLAPRERTRSNYRVYASDAVARVRLIRMSQSLGFTVADIRTLLRLLDVRVQQCAAVRTVIERRLDTLDRQMAELREHRRRLRSMHGLCENPGVAERCRALERLNRGGRPSS
ncbi:MAG TPA: MerR family transcriptional regulator [Candidatus Krumholzibacteria bacterium]|nr:MerR family transcriptional regulator [Candidatus Krumholzibacteria bacterium]